MNSSEIERRNISEEMKTFEVIHIGKAQDFYWWKEVLGIVRLGVLVMSFNGYLKVCTWLYQDLRWLGFLKFLRDE